MTELGYVEGENIVYDLRYTNFEPEREREIIQSFVEQNVDLIVAFPTEAAMTAKAGAQGTGIPVVFAFANTEGTGLAESVRRPGGNTTGVRYPGPDVAVNRFEVMMELAPDAKRICIPYQDGYPIVPGQLEILREVSAERGVTLIEAPMDDAQDAAEFFGERSGRKDIGMDAVLFIAEPLAVTPDAFLVIAEFATRHKIPAGGAIFEVDGYRSVYGAHPSVVDSGIQAANQADKVLQGSPAGTIPVVSAENSLEIDFAAAETLDLEVPEGLLSRANRIIR
jgi:putative ABC transport system substrate-binding protein